jgi:AcrR family transcriptional regulator
MSITKTAAPPPRRRRLSSEIAREQIIASARRLLLEEGPAAVTLKAVAGELGMSHANLLHHFGSAAGLRSALIEDMSHSVIQAVEAVSSRVRTGQADRREVVDLVFDAVDSGGAGRLIAWMSLAGEIRQLEPVFQAVRDLAAALQASDPAPEPDSRQRITAEILAVLLPSIGDALVGEALHAALGRDRETGRELALLGMRTVAEASAVLRDGGGED